MLLLNRSVCRQQCVGILHFSTNLRQKVIESKQKSQLIGRSQLIDAVPRQAWSLILLIPLQQSCYSQRGPVSLRLILISEACVMRLHYQMSVMNIKHDDSYSLGYINTPSASRTRRVRSDVLTVLFFSR